MENNYDEYQLANKLNLKEWRRLMRFMVKHKGKMIPLFCCCVFSAIVDACIPYFSRYAFNNYIYESTTEGIWAFILLYLLVITIQSMCTVIFCRLGFYLEMNFGRDMRDMCYHKLQQQSLSYYNVTPVGYLLSRVLNDTNNLGGMLSWGLADSLWTVSYLTFCLVSMFLLNWKLSLLVLAVLAVSMVICYITESKILKRNREVRKANAILTASFNENITGAKTIKSLAVEQEVCDAFDGLNRSMRKKSLLAKRLRSVFQPIVLTLGSTILAIIISNGMVFVSDKEGIGTLAVFITYALSIIDPIGNITDFVVDLIALQVNVERINRLVDATPAVIDREDIIEKYGDVFNPKRENWEPINGDIEFEDVTFRYPDGNVDVLSHFNLKIKAGSCIAIVGETGAGKSTLVNLACRFFEPTEGRVLIDGTDYRERSLNWLHSEIGYVLQQPHLFSGTIRENIAYGKPDATEEEIIAAAKSACAHDFIVGLKDGYDTAVGEGGDMLSTGQKQLISIARAIIVNPRIFVLDEATSSVDTQTEQLITNVISSVLEHRTSFVIAHRLSTIKNADLILMVDNGKIVEQGTHRELLRKKGLYYSLYSRQFENEERGKIFERVKV